MENLFLNWSSGKDAALALYRIQEGAHPKNVHLVTTVNEFHDRVSMHGLRKELLVKQLASINLPYSFISLPEMPSMEVYEEKLSSAVNELKEQGFNQAAFGDIFLEDLKEYRDEFFDSRGIETIYPLWKNNSTSLINEFVALGFKAIIIACNEVLGKSFLGTIIDEHFIEKIPEGIDPCGENGEFHTFCFEGPVFDQVIPFEVLGSTYKTYPPLKDGKTNGFWFLDLE